MSREWKPGDVAWLTVRELDGPQHHVGLCYRGGPINPHASHGVARWVLADHTDVWTSVTDARPLVVINPEDREQVERLLSRYLSIYDGMDVVPSTGEIASMQAALREFANPTPPKPDEPKGWGAVVEDDTGAYWTLFAPEAGLWINYRDGQRRWDQINLVRVVDEGVTP